MWFEESETWEWTTTPFPETMPCDRCVGTVVYTTNKSVIDPKELEAMHFAAVEYVKRHGTGASNSTPQEKVVTHTEPAKPKEKPKRRIRLDWDDGS
jgi:hypothetical protein